MFIFILIILLGFPLAVQAMDQETYNQLHDDLLSTIQEHRQQHEADMERAYQRRRERQSTQQQQDLLQQLQRNQLNQSSGACRGLWVGGRYCQTCTAPNGHQQTICN